MKSIKNYLLLFSFATLFLVSCSIDDDNSGGGVLPPEAYENGILVTNEGPFGAGTGTVTYVSNDFLTVEQNVYRKVNNSDIGNALNGMGFHDSDAYLVANNSHRVMVVDRYSFELKDSITTELENPRHFVSNGTNGYISNWGDPMDENDDYIAVVDLTTYTVTGTIPVALGPETMVAHQNKVYVAHQGAWGQNNLVSVINGTTVEKTIEVGDVPNSMVVVGNYLYVLGGGNPDYSGNETAGSLTKIKLSDNEIDEIFYFEDTEHPANLVAEDNYVYYTLNGGIYRTNLGGIMFPGDVVAQGNFYSLGIRNGYIYATDAFDYSSHGVMNVYDLNGFIKVHEIPVGLIPGGIYFND